MTAIEQLVSKLSDELSMDCPDVKDGAYSFYFDGELELKVSPYQSDGYQFFSPIACVDQELSESSLSDMLTANLFGQLTGKSILGLDPSKKTLTLRQESLNTLSFQSFYNDFEDFLNYVEFWKNQSKELINKQNNSKGLL